MKNENQNQVKGLLHTHTHTHKPIPEQKSFGNYEIHILSATRNDNI